MCPAFIPCYDLYIHHLAALKICSVVLPSCIYFLLMFDLACKYYIQILASFDAFKSYCIYMYGLGKKLG